MKKFIALLLMILSVGFSLEAGGKKKAFTIKEPYFGEGTKKNKNKNNQIFSDSNDESDLFLCKAKSENIKEISFKKGDKAIVTTHCMGDSVLLGRVDFYNKVVRIEQYGYKSLGLDASFKTLKDILENWPTCYKKIMFIDRCVFVNYLKQLASRGISTNIPYVQSSYDDLWYPELNKLWDGEKNDLLCFIPKEYQEEFYSIWRPGFGSCFVPQQWLKEVSDDVEDIPEDVSNCFIL